MQKHESSRDSKRQNAGHNKEQQANGNDRDNDWRV
jgi:hypothetical protein